MDPLVATVLVAMFLGAVMLCHWAWLDRGKARRNARRLADRYAQPYQAKEPR